MKRLGLLSGLVLAACGGGEVREDRNSGWLTFEPSRIELSFYQGDPAAVDLVATSTKGLVGPVNVGAFDESGVLDGEVSIEDMGMQFSAHLPLDSALSLGEHTGSFEIRVCRDDSLTCAQPWGGPWLIPYRITVLPGTHLTPLAPLSGAGPWRTLGGDAGHTRYVPATLDPASFSRRWAVPAASVSLAVEGGRVFVTTTTGAYSEDWAVTAFSEVDGHIVWTHVLDGPYWVGPPATGHGHVYVASNGRAAADSALWALDQATGDVAKALPMSSQGGDRWATPEVVGDAVYSQDGYYGGFSKFDGVGLTRSWFSNDALWYTGGYTALADDTFVYLLNGFGLQALSVSDGKEWFTIEWDAATPRCSLGESPVMGTDGSVYHFSPCGWDDTAQTFKGQLERYDVVARTRSWIKQESYNSEPALADGVLYIANGSSFDALDAGTGERLWSWRIPDDSSATRRQVVVVGHHAFVTSMVATYVVDLETHQQVWSYPAAGRLAVSENGVLYILTFTGRLVAINLH